MKYVSILILAALPTLAFAQQPSPSQTALAVNQAVSNMALSLESAQHQIAALQAENEKLKAKCGDACKDK